MEVFGGIWQAGFLSGSTNSFQDGWSKETDNVEV